MPIQLQQPAHQLTPIGFRGPLTSAWASLPPCWAKPAIAGLIVGIVGIWLPEIFGTGLTQMKQIFGGTVFPITTLVALAIAKTILTPTSLGSGFAGGVIGPALAIGSALGYVYGALVAQISPTLGISPIAYALARRFQPGSAYTFALPGAGIHLKRGTFTVEHTPE